MSTGSTSGIAFNHLGHCVSDLARARAFFENVFDFKFWFEIQPPDEPSDRLLGMQSPIGMTACYLVRDGLVLELLHYADAGTIDPGRQRVMNEPGLTHLSLAVEDIEGIKDRVKKFGGEILESTNIGMAYFIRDPDGQFIELLPMAYRQSLPPLPS